MLAPEDSSQSDEGPPERWGNLLPASWMEWDWESWIKHRLINFWSSLFKNFNHIVNLPCCVSFKCLTKWFRNTYAFFKKKIYLTVSVFVAAWGSLVAACGIQFPDQRLNLHPLHWECWVLSTGPPGKSPYVLFFRFFSIKGYYKMLNIGISPAV